MKQTLIIIALIAIAFNTTSCKKRKDKVLISVDSMAINYYGGFSATPRHGHYMIANGTVKEDTAATIADRAPYYYTRDMGKDAYDQVAHLLNEVPEGMKDRNNYTFSDNTVDGPSTRVTAYVGGNTYSWDCGGTAVEYSNGNAKSDTPEYIAEFIKKLQNAGYFLYTR